jgi:site-specific recombinase XerD
VAERAVFVPTAAPFGPMPEACAAAMAGLPGSADVDAYRRLVLSRVGALAQVLRRAEVVADAGRLTPRMLAELWLWVAYLEHVRGFRGATTVAQYARSVCRFLEWATKSGADFRTLDVADFDAWQKHLALELRHSATWRVRQVAAVRNFYGWRGTRGLGEDLAADLRGPREPTGMPRKYTPLQLQQLLTASAQQRNPLLQLRDKTVLLFLLATGARREELSRTDLRDLHLGQRSGLVRFKGKGAKAREVSFEGPVVDALRAWLLQREQLPFPVEQDAVFIGLEGIGRGCRLRPRAIERRVATCAKAAGLRDWGVHRFRVTFATALYDNGAGIEEIRLLMGHESIETTRRYLAVSERMRRTRLPSDVQHQALGTREQGKPRWVRAVLGDT